MSADGQAGRGCPCSQAIDARFQLVLARHSQRPSRTSAAEVRAAVAIGAVLAKHDVALTSVPRPADVPANRRVRAPGARPRAAAAAAVPLVLDPAETAVVRARAPKSASPSTLALVHSGARRRILAAKAARICTSTSRTPSRGAGRGAGQHAQPRRRGGIDLVGSSRAEGDRSRARRPETSARAPDGWHPRRAPTASEAPCLLRKDGGANRAQASARACARA